MSSGNPILDRLAEQERSYADGGSVARDFSPSQLSPLSLGGFSGGFDGNNVPTVPLAGSAPGNGASMFPAGTPIGNSGSNADLKRPDLDAADLSAIQGQQPYDASKPWLGRHDQSFDGKGGTYKPLYTGNVGWGENGVGSDDLRMSHIVQDVTPGKHAVGDWQHAYDPTGKYEVTARIKPDSSMADFVGAASMAMPMFGGFGGILGSGATGGLGGLGLITGTTSPVMSAAINAVGQGALSQAMGGDFLKSALTSGAGALSGAMAPDGFKAIAPMATKQILASATKR